MEHNRRPFYPAHMTRAPPNPHATKANNNTQHQYRKRAKTKLTHNQAKMDPYLRI